MARGPFRPFTVTAPAKIILHGEYAVVFGKEAIALSAGLYTKVRVEKSAIANTIKLKLDDLNYETSWDVNQLLSLNFQGGKSDPAPLQEDVIGKALQKDLSTSVRQSLLVFLYLFLDLSARRSEDSSLLLEVSVKSQFPTGCGLGSSAAYSVSLTAALFKAILPGHYSEEDIRRWALVCEHVFHGKPSGIDNSICTYGGAILYKEGQIVEKLTLDESFSALLVYTKVSRNTKSLVTALNEKVNKFPGIINAIFNAMGEISCRAWQLIKENAYKSPDREVLLSINQHLLASIGAGHESIEKIIKISSQAGFGAKLTGAGGGGCCVVLLHKGSEAVEQLVCEMEKEGFVCWQVSFGGPGVQVTY